MMVGVLDKHESVVIIKNTDTEEWISEPEVTRKKRNIQVFIDICTNKHIREFIKLCAGLL